MRQNVVLLSLIVSVLGHIPELRRSVEKSGFHRDLSSSISVQAELLTNVENSREISCLLLFTETIPSGAYVDPYQIASLRPFRGPDAIVRDKVDIEKPEYMSEPLTVEIFTRLYRTGEFWISNYTLPVHLRYHATSETEDFALVSFIRPEVAVRCWNTTTKLQINGYTGTVAGVKSSTCSSDSNQLCDWTVIETTAVCDDQLIVPGINDDLKHHCQQEGIAVSVPVGRANDYYLVTLVTLLFTVGGCLLLGFYVINKDHAESWKKVQ